MSDKLLKQTPGKPLFGDLLWSRPENKLHAGKLAIIGGNLYGFSAVGQAYQVASKSAGQIQLLLPDKLQKTVGKVFAEGNFAPSTPSGSFSTKSLANALDLANWADGVLFAGDFGRNSETAIMVEQLTKKYSGPLTITQDAIDFFNSSPFALLNRPKTVIVGSFAQIQRLLKSAKTVHAITYDMDMLVFVEVLQNISKRFPATIVTKHHNNIFVASSGKVSISNTLSDKDIWRVTTAASCSVWQIQQPQKLLEAITCGVYDTIAESK